MWGLQQSYAVLKQTGDAVVRESYTGDCKAFQDGEHANLSRFTSSKSL